MTNIFVSSDDVKVIGGTANVNVEVDFGPQGDRGGIFLVGNGNPNTVSHSITLQLLDLYINVQATDDDYMGLYQYVNVSGVNTWVLTGTLIKDKFSVVRNVAFTDGKTTSEVDFRVSNIAPQSLVGGLTAANFNVQCTFSDPENPIAHSIVIKPLAFEAGTGDQILPVDINAVEFSEGSWVSLNKTVSIHFLITVV
jgi:hypothetical protein